MKIVIALSILFFLNGCVQNSAFLGPVYTFGTTGSALQAGASYGTNYVVRKTIKNKTPEVKNNEIKKTKVDTNPMKKILVSVDIKDNPEDFFKIVKKHVKKKNKNYILSTQ